MTTINKSAADNQRTPTARGPRTRKHTRFRVCSNHTSWKTQRRYRLAEMFCEGGPGSGKPCDSADPCRIWPGTDHFTPDICTSEADWPTKWAINI